MIGISKISALAALAIAVATPAFATTITQWTFESETGNYTYPNTPALNSPAPETGSGVASTLGMDNAYTFNNGEGPGSVAWSDTTTGNGGIVWRVRGPSNAAGGGPGISNGWNSAAPQYTQGASFAVDTAGYNHINVSFDWQTTTQGVADLQPRYSLNGGTTWTNFGPLLEMAPADVNVGFDTFPLDFSGISGANDNPNFAVELVSAFNAASGTYANAASVKAGSPAPLNNSSGNWRFDNITFSGTPDATPEPTSIALLGLGAAGLLARRRKAV